MAPAIAFKSHIVRFFDFSIFQQGACWSARSAGKNVCCSSVRSESTRRTGGLSQPRKHHTKANSIHQQRKVFDCACFNNPKAVPLHAFVVVDAMWFFSLLRKCTKMHQHWRSHPFDGRLPSSQGAFEMNDLMTEALLFQVDIFLTVGDGGHRRVASVLRRG